MAFRILSGVLLLISVLFWPFWVSVILGLAAIAYFPFFLEAVFLFLLSDLLFWAPEEKFLGMVGVSFVGALAAFIILEIFKKKLR